MLLAVAVLAAVRPGCAAAQQTAPVALSPVSVSFQGADVRDVVRFFATYAGRSMVVGQGVEGTVTADIDGQPWDVALDAILQAQGLVARELPSGIVLVEAPAAATAAPEPLVTRAFRLSYARASEVQGAVQTMLSPDGAVSVLASTNTLVVTDRASVVRRVGELVGQP